MLSVEPLDHRVHWEARDVNIRISELLKLNNRVAVADQRRDDEWLFIFVGIEEVLVKLLHARLANFALRTLERAAVIVGSKNARQRAGRGGDHVSQQAMNAFGYVILTGKTFTTGATINNPNEVLLNTADGEYYKWTGSFASGPKVVPANSTPASTGGIAPGAWLGIGDASLRAALAANDGEKFVGECQTIAQLRTIEPTFDKQRITLREHTAGTGKGGGQFRAVLSGSGYTDNNGSIIKTTGGAAWLRINADITNPLMFGAVASGGADDSAAINAAIAATSAECDGLGYSYQIASTVAINQPNKRLRRARISLTAAAAVSTVMFRIRANYAEVIECIFDGNGGANTSAALIWEGALCQLRS